MLSLLLRSADVLSSVLPLYRRLLDEEDIRMLVYSGDVDAIVPGQQHLFAVRAELAPACRRGVVPDLNLLAHTISIEPAPACLRTA